MMNERTFWDKLRVLVTNCCNYRCPFCHNEGQSSEIVKMLNLTSLEQFVDYLSDIRISEFHFSGGEPFLNKNIVKMIRYVNDNTSWGLGCATNLSRITKEQIYDLKDCRVKFNIQFPYANPILFKKSTVNGDYNFIVDQIKRIQDAGLRVGLNAVIQNNNMYNIRELILFAIKNNIALKLLPQIGLEGSSKFKDLVYPILKDYEVEHIDKHTGALRWVEELDGKRTTVLYIDSPCFTNDISICRQFGELRVHPDMSLQPCIMKEPECKLDLSRGKEYVISKMTELWKNFNKCC